MPDQPTTPQPPKTLSVDLNDLEIVETVVIKDPEVVKQLKTIKQLGLEGVSVGVSVGL